MLVPKQGKQCWVANRQRTLAARKTPTLNMKLRSMTPISMRVIILLFRKNRTVLFANRSNSQTTGTRYERNCQKIQHILSDGLFLDSQLDRWHFGSLLVLYFSFLALQNGSLDHFLGRGLQHRLFNFCLSVTTALFSFTSGYFIVKFLIFCLFLLFGIMSLKTVFEADRRREVVVCSRLIHGSALTHTSREDN